ncbi:hypothetical protein VNI00_004565 [Paramarasmius palmivorus]|uniref:Uncharacterized protein n=1 Tax=Paramarasmius palmivorus TaxID=297713 RepID=A0AAW0DFE6_9AGAR
MIPSYLRNIKFQIYHSYLKHTLYPQPISCNMRRRTVHGPVILSKTYIITNAEHANAAYLCNDQKGALVTTVNHRSATPEAAIKWELEQLSNKKYTIKNVKTGTYAGVKFEDKNSEVVSHKSETQWEIYEVKNGNYSYGVSLLVRVNMFPTFDVAG